MSLFSCACLCAVEGVVVPSRQDSGLKMLVKNAGNYFLFPSCCDIGHATDSTEGTRYSTLIDSRCNFRKHRIRILGELWKKSRHRGLVFKTGNYFIFLSEKHRKGSTELGCGSLSTRRLALWSSVEDIALNFRE